MEYKLGEIVYHKMVYNYKEPLKIVGIREHELELVGIREYELDLEGDYSGGTHDVNQQSWLSINNVSRIFNYSFKKECLDYAMRVINNEYIYENIHTVNYELTNMILTLTNEIKR